MGVVDRDGYGSRTDQSDLDRLVEDCRTLSASGIERIAAAWDHRPSDSKYLEAERAALHAVETSGRGAEWDATRNRLLGLTERGTPLISWKAEHGEIGHKAEDALLGAALALIAQPKLSHHHAKVLLHPMAEMVPWLLTATAPP
jgi:hypothetical protein